MALKGKKKSRSRGSQARRRPASAPRPTSGGGSKLRWYQTTTGLVVAFLVAVTVVILAWWFIADNRSEAEALETTQAELTDYTETVETTIQDVTPVAADLAGAAELKDDQLAEKAKTWKSQLSTAQTAVAQAAPPTGIEAMNGLLTQAILLYVQSAEQYELLPQLEGRVREEVSAKAAASFLAANNIFSSAIEILDTARVDNELSSSGLQTPGTAPEATMPPGELEVPGEEAEQGDE